MAQQQSPLEAPDSNRQAAQSPSSEQPRVIPVRYYSRWVVAALLAGIAVSVVSTLATSENIDYSVVRQYLFSSDILAGVVRTIELSVVSMAIAIVLGVAIATMNLSRNPVAKVFATMYLWILRGIPFLLTLILLYNIALVFPNVVLGVPGTSLTIASWDTNALITPFIAAVIGLAVTESAYYSEIVRGGLLSVDPGQMEAAHAVGMPPLTAFRLIVLPQALRVIIPPSGNEFIGMLKYSAFASVIGFQELTGSAQNISSTNARTIELLIVAAVWYLAMTSVLTVGQMLLERRLGRSLATTRPRQRKAARTS